jgi:chromosomal replication initiator protein
MAEWDYKLFWDESINQLREELGEGEYTIWLSNLGYISAGETEITISTPSAFFQEKFRAKYHKKLEEKLHELTGKAISLVLEVAARRPDDENAADAPEKPIQDKKPKETGRQEKAAVQVKGKHPQLREEFTFEKYIIGENNAFAANAALAIARNPGTAYNPFLIYGGVGMGKTHLMQAIGNFIHANSDSKIIFITAEDFLNEFISSMPVTGGPNKMATFKNKYRNSCDVLLIDDIHFFQGDKPGVQEEMFYTFNALMDQKKQLAFTCDRPASELKSMNERLKNRFESCLNVDLQPPKYEIRCAIIRSTIKNRGISVPDEVVDIIAKNISSNVRDLISALNKLFAYTELVNEPITPENTQKALIEFFSPVRRQLNMSIEQVQRVVAEFFQLYHIDLKGKKRTKKITSPRHIAMYLTKELTEYSLTEIGEAFGKDHSTVISAINKIEGQLMIDPELEPTLQKLRRLIRESGVKS